MIAEKAIKGVIYSEQVNDEHWLIAQLLEHDINAQAKTIEGLQTALTATVVAEWQAHDKGLSEIGPAPKRFFDMCQDKNDVEFEEEVDGIGVAFSLCNIAA